MKKDKDYKSILINALGGILFTIIGIISSYYFIYLTIEDSKKGVNIDYSFKGILLGPTLFVMGIYLIIYKKERVFSIEKLAPIEKKIFYLALFLGFALGFLALYFVNQTLEINGYDTSVL
ncbi:MAG: hypothetical protein QG594_493 [Bacteroidota bacterium]|nr:hypothetical protein [Bacteroidota bacterium]